MKAGVLDHYSFLGNELRLWVIALAAIAVVMLVLVLLRRVLIRRLSQAHTTEHRVDDVVLTFARRTRTVLLFFVVTFVSFRMLELPPKLMATLQATAIVTFFLQIGLWLAGLIEYGISRYREKRGVPDPAASEGLDLANAAAKFILWSLILLVTLDNLGVNVTALVTGLGVGGVAVALALQTILGDLFSSLSITIDKPFVPGDFIVVGDQRGTVKVVGMKTTRITSLSGEELVYSNSELLKMRIQNFRHMRERRVIFTFGVTYQTPREVVERIPSIVKQAIERRELTRFDRSHFQRFGESALEFETVYFILSSDYNVYMDIQQSVNLEIMREFEREGIVFAYPTRTVWMGGEPAQA